MFLVEGGSITLTIIHLVVFLFPISAAETQRNYQVQHFSGKVFQKLWFVKKKVTKGVLVN